MNNVTDLIESLLYQCEGEALDFKRDQYPFIEADNLKKSELLKDLLAFANSWRRTDAYILIGIQAEIGKRHTVIGTEEHFDDAQLQQFINSKTNRKLIFSYGVYTFENKKIGIIHIPIQERPIYASKDFEKVKKEFVYYRLGSSTSVATPEEIGKMGKDSHLQFFHSKPIIHLEYVNINTRESLGKDLTLQCIAFERNSSRIPNFQKESNGSIYSGLSISSFEALNSDYLRECETYIRTLALVQPIGFSFHNQSYSFAQNVHIEIHGNSQNCLTIFDSDSEPEKPVEKKMETLSRSIKSIHARKIKTTVEHKGSNWIISVEIGNIKPQQKICTEDPFFIGCTTSLSLNLEAFIYADNLPEPQKEVLCLNFEAVPRPEIPINNLQSEIRFFRSHLFIANNLAFHEKI